MSEYIHKSHNVSRLMYHIVFPAKYRKVIIDEQVDRVIKETCIEISKRYPINFLEIGTDKDHIHFLVQSVPRYSQMCIRDSISTMETGTTTRRNFWQIPREWMNSFLPFWPSRTA